MPASDRLGNAVLEAQTTPLAAFDVSRAERFGSQTHWPFFARLRQEDPVHFCASSIHGPYWSITRYADIAAIERDHRAFSSAGNVIIGDVPAEFDAPAFATADPPVHTRERRAVLPAVSPKRLVTLAPRVRANIGTLLDGLPRHVPFDWVERVSIELTTQMVALLFDFPWEERKQFAAWCEAVVTTPAPGAIVATWAERDAMMADYRSRMEQLWHQRTAAGAGEDILSALAHNSDTVGMIDDPAHLLGTLTLIAGANEAARGALSGGIVAFDEYPEELEKLRERPALMANAASEIVRWQTPISHMRRTATRDVEFCGKHINKGEKVVLWYCSGNRDEQVFQQADRFQIERPNAARHLAYGFGIHRCLGSHVAELQVQLLWEEILKRFAKVELAGEAMCKASNFSSGYEQLSVRIVPW
jgi:cytochrome P450